MEGIQVLLRVQDDAIQDLSWQLELLEVSEDIKLLYNHLVFTSWKINDAFEGLCSTNHAKTEEPTFQEVMDQLTRLLPTSAKSKSKQTRSRGRCTVTQLTNNTSNRVYCEFCFTKTGKQFFHAEIKCNRKNKFSQKVKSKN
jgi:hypothetical protein